MDPLLAADPAKHILDYEVLEMPLAVVGAHVQG